MSCDRTDATLCINLGFYPPPDRGNVSTYPIVIVVIKKSQRCGTDRRERSDQETFESLIPATKTTKTMMKIDY